MLYEENEKIYYLCEYILHKFIGKLKSKDLIWFHETHTKTKKKNNEKIKNTNRILHKIKKTIISVFFFCPKSETTS